MMTEFEERDPEAVRSELRLRRASGQMLLWGLRGSDPGFCEGFNAAAAEFGAELAELVVGQMAALVAFYAPAAWVVFAAALAAEGPEHDFGVDSVGAHARINRVVRLVGQTVAGRDRERLEAGIAAELTLYYGIPAQ